MAANTKEVTIRVAREEWEEWDDKRHRLKTSWQAVGLELFRAWHRGKPSGDEGEKLAGGLSARDAKTLETLAEMMRDYPAAGESIGRVISLLSKSLRQKN